MGAVSRRNGTRSATTKIAVTAKGAAKARRVRRFEMPTPSSRPVDVLVVEDDAALREAVVRGLRKAGWTVAAAASGGEGVAAASRTHPAVIVLDLLLPDAGGMGVAREIRREPALREVPVLFVTGLSTPLARSAVAPEPLLQKPFTYRQLLSRVRALMPSPAELRDA